MRYTLIELTQRILESMDSDEVNSISDTSESLAVANTIKECYYGLMGEVAPKERMNLFHLDASTDNTKPTVMYLPSNVLDIEFLKYNIGPDLLDTNFRELKYLPIGEFFEYMNGLDVSADWVASQEVQLDGQDFQIKYRNDVSPSYWTSGDDRTILMDAYDSSYETTLTSSRTYGYGLLIPTFQMVDNYIPDLDPRQFQLLLQDAKAQCFVEMKQTTNEKAEKKLRVNKILTYKTKDSTDPRPEIKKHKGFGR